MGDKSPSKTGERTPDALDEILGDLVQRVNSKSQAPERTDSHEQRDGARRAAAKGKMFWQFWTDENGAKENPEDGVYVRTTVFVKGGKPELGKLKLVQCMSSPHRGAILDVQFSKEGMFMASGDSSGKVVLWRVLQAVKEDFEQCEPQLRCESIASRPTGPKLFASDPWKVFTGHKGPVVQLSWSASQFLLSASEDCTARLWHATRDQCLYVFQHQEPVTSVSFLPKLDTMFATGSFDSKVRVWHIPEKKVLHWHNVSTQPTAVTFSKDARTLICGLEDGVVCFYKFDIKDGLEFFTQIECRNRRGKQKTGKRVTGVESIFLSSSERGGKAREMLLVTTNDSRIRVCSMETYLCLFKLKGATNSIANIRASVNEQMSHIVCPSEDKTVCLWSADSFDQDPSSIISTPLTSKKLTGNAARKLLARESFHAHGSQVNSAVFAPRRTGKAAREETVNLRSRTLDTVSSASTPVPPTEYLEGSLIVTGGSDGHIHIFENRTES